MEKYNVIRQEESRKSGTGNITSEKSIKSHSESYTISVLTASYNEVQNIELWLQGIFEIYMNKKLDCLKEIVIVDDGSQDGTVEKIIAIKESYPLPIKLVRRNRKMGTLNAHISGAQHCISDYTVIMDCDLQHSIELLPKLIEKLDRRPDVVIGSRYVKGGMSKWSPYRGLVSRVATFIAHMMIWEAKDVKDPLSGYFLIKTDLIRELKPYDGMYKLLLYVLSAHKKLNKIEVPFSMIGRTYGESKVVNNPFKTILKYLREVLVFWANRMKIVKRH